MKNLITLVLICISKVAFCQITKPQKIYNPETDNLKNFTGIEQKLYPDGKLLYWKELVDGNNSGLWLEYYPDGTLRFRAQWKNDLGHGKWEYFYENGKLRTLGVYENDLPIGIHFEYYPNGNLKSESNYIAGKLNGDVSKFDENGLEISSQNYKDGIKILDKPVVFQEGIISTEENDEWTITFEPDGKTLYFDRRNKGEQQQKIYKSNLINDVWTKPERVSFSIDIDEAPFVTFDGKRMYFASFRKLPSEKTIGFQDMNIWYLDKTSTGWSTPNALKSNINKIREKSQNWPTNYETSPTTDLDGNLYYWTKAINSNDANVFVAKINSDKNFENPVEIGNVINHKGFDSSPVISPDGNYLFFASSDRSGGFGNEDIFYSKRENGNWTVPENLSTNINSMDNEICPRFSPDGKYFFFSSDRNAKVAQNGEKIYSIYYMETQYLLVK